MILKKPTRVTFDATNPEHRKIAANVLKTNSWGKSPILFELEPEFYDVISMVKDKLFAYYFANDSEIAAT